MADQNSPISSAHPIGWDDIANQAYWLKHDLAGIEFPSQDLRDAYKAAQASPLVTYNLKLRADYGALFYQPAGEFWSDIRDNALELAGGRPPPTAPQYLRTSHQADLRIIEQGLQRRELSLEFIISWGRLHRARGAIDALILAQDDAESSFDQAMAGATSDDRTLQKYWYAHWMAKQGILKQRGRDWTISRDELAVLCQSIDKSEREPKLYDRGWFAAMYTTEDSDDPGIARLKKTYIKISRLEIGRMVRNSLIPLSALPPLRESEFPLISLPRG